MVWTDKGKAIQRPPNRKMISPQLAEILEDRLLAIFSALAYTVVWEQTAAHSFVIRSVFIQPLLDYSSAVLFIFNGLSCYPRSVLY